MISQNLAAIIGLAGLLCCNPAVAQTTDKFEYDALGRLITVTNNGQAKVGYCYDAAGNRGAVNNSDGGSAGTGTCVDAIPAPSKPTGLWQGSHQGGGCVMRWSAQSGVDVFKLKLKGTTNPVQLPGTTTQYSANTQCGEWLQACNSVGICSDRANF